MFGRKAKRIKELDDQYASAVEQLKFWVDRAIGWQKQMSSDDS